MFGLSTIIPIAEVIHLDANLQPNCTFYNRISHEKARNLKQILANLWSKQYTATRLLFSEHRIALIGAVTVFASHQNPIENTWNDQMNHKKRQQNKNLK